MLPKQKPHVTELGIASDAPEGRPSPPSHPVTHGKGPVYLPVIIDSVAGKRGRFNPWVDTEPQTTLKETVYNICYVVSKGRQARDQVVIPKPSI